MENVPRSEQEYRLWVLLHQTRDAVLRVRENELSQNDVTVVEAGALYIIDTLGDKATPATIAKYLLRQHHTVTALLKRMESKDLIARAESPERKNTWIISLTKKGKKIYKESNARDSMHALMSIFSDEEQKQFDALLTRLRDRAIQYAASAQVQIPPFP